MFPIRASYSFWLNQSTNSRVTNSTASIDRHDPSRVVHLVPVQAVYRLCHSGGAAVVNVVNRCLDACTTRRSGYFMDTVRNP